MTFHCVFGSGCCAVEHAPGSSPSLGAPWVGEEGKERVVGWCHKGSRWRMAVFLKGQTIRDVRLGGAS